MSPNTPRAFARSQRVRRAQPWFGDSGWSEKGGKNLDVYRVWRDLGYLRHSGSRSGDFLTGVRNRCNRNYYFL